MSSYTREAGENFGSQCQHLAIYLEEIDNFNQCKPGNFKDMEKYTELFDIAIVTLKEANCLEELQGGLFYMKLLKSFLHRC